MVGAGRGQWRRQWGTRRGRGGGGGITQRISGGLDEVVIGDNEVVWRAEDKLSFSYFYSRT